MIRLHFVVEGQTDIKDYRFIPYIQCHEFEALLLSDPSKFEFAYPNKKDEIKQLIAKLYFNSTHDDIINTNDYQRTPFIL